MRMNMKKLMRATLLLSTALLAAAPAYAAPLYFPHIATSIPWETEIAVINTGNQTVTGTLKGVSDGGQDVETMPIMLPAQGRRQIIVATEFTNHSNIGYMVFDTTSDAVQGYTKFSIAGAYRAAIPAVKEISTADIYITHIASSSEWWTGLSLVNTASAEKVLTIAFSDGQSRQITLAANEHRALDIAQAFFNNQPQPGIESAVLSNASGIVGLELFGTTNGKQLDGILLTDKTASTLYYPHVAGGEWWTGIVAYNPSALAGMITITPYSTDGTALTSSIFSIAGKAKLIGTVTGLGLPADAAWFTLSSTTPLSGFELFGTLDGNLLAPYAASGGAGAKTGVLAKIEKAGWTGIAFVNTEANAASVTLTAYDDNGAVLTTETIPVGGHAKVVSPAEAIFSQDISGATYITYSSDRDVVGFQLNGSSDGTMLDGLPAPPLTAPAVDTTPPIVSAVSPANAATNVPAAAAVSVTFNEAMNPSSITAATFTVTAGGAPVAGAISSAGTTYTFTPSGSLAAGTLRTVTVTTGVMDVAGNAMAANFTSTFTTISGAVTVDISIGDFFFAPASVTVNVGDTIRWTNNGAAPHTTTSGTSPTGDGKWASPLMSSGESFSFTFTQAGAFPYFCAVHPFMVGTVAVQ